MSVRAFAEADWPVVRTIIDEVAAEGRTYAMDLPSSDEQARGFWLRPPGAVVVAEVEGEILATARMGPNRPAQGSHIGTASFMVSGGARGRGLGRELGEHVVAWHRREGFRGIQFNAVVSTNTAAVRLWESLGFDIVGTVPGAFRLPTGDHADLHVMFLDLSASA